MIDLILGLVEPTEGTIAIDDVSLTELTTSWRSRVAYVPQDVALFDATVAQNVALSWTGDFDRDRVRRALAQAQLLDTIDARPDGIDGRIGGLHGSVTVITVAHRLATVQHSDQIYFMSGGVVAAQGRFDELVASTPEFARQAQLAGLAERP